MVRSDSELRYMLQTIEIALSDSEISLEDRLSLHAQKNLVEWALGKDVKCVTDFVNSVR